MIKIRNFFNARSTMQAVAAVVVLLGCLPLFSQVNLGRILGAITDQSGGLVAGATVTIVDVARGVSRPLTTDSAGQYNAPGLIPGMYTVRAEAKGFQTVEHQNILLEVGQDVRVDFTLQPGAQTQTITVTEQTPIMNTTNAELGTTLETQQFDNLPITGRQYWRLVDFAPGMLAIPGYDSNFTSNGGRLYNTVWMFDGIDETERWSGVGPVAGQRQTSIVPVDAIQEAKVIENESTEYGWRSGAVVSVGIKSGTNNIHGSAYFFDRNTAFDARNAFLSPTQSPSVDKLEDFGVSIGGPVKKDKIFYFLSYEGNYFAVGAPSVDQGPTTVAGAGVANSFPDAIAALNTAKVPLSQLSLNLAGCPTAASLAGVTNASMINCTGGVWGFFPASTTRVDPFTNYGNSHNGIGKIDYHLNDHHSLNLEYYYGTGAEFDAHPVQAYWAEASPQNTQLGRAVWVWTPNSTWVNEARFGSDTSNGPTVDGQCIANLGQPNYASAFGYTPGTPGQLPGCDQFAPITVGSFAQIGGDGGGGTTFINHFSVLDTVSYTRGKHLFKFGAEIHEIYWRGSGKLPGLTGESDFGNTGINIFNGATPLEDFLSGTPDSGTLLIGDNVLHDLQPAYAAFAQDDWRVTPRVTVNLGLRYEYMGPIVERNNELANFDPNAPEGLLQQTNGHPVYRTDPHLFAPRLGLAWDITGNGKTVIRVGGSIVDDTIVDYNQLLHAGTSGALQLIPTGWNLTAPDGIVLPKAGNISFGTVSLTGNTPGQPPLGQITWLANTPIFNNTGSALSCGNGMAETAPGNPAVTNPAPCTINGINPNLPSGYVTTWNLSVQHAFTRNLALNVSYVGTHGTSLAGVIDINAPIPGVKGTAAEQLRRPYTENCLAPGSAGATATNSAPGGLGLNPSQCFPYLGAVKYVTGNLESNYAGLQAQLTERVSHGLTFTAGYTFAHALDDISSEQSFVPYENSNPNLNYGNANYDVRDHFTLTASYDIPGKKSPAQLLEGWQINSTVTVLSAFPYNAVDTNSDLSGTGGKFDRWNLFGPASNFKGGGVGTLPCYGVAGSSFASAGDCTMEPTLAAMPQQCQQAAATEPTNPAVPASNKNATGLEALANFGCYMAGNSVIVPPAQGTFGTMTRDLLRGLPFSEWDFSVHKNMKIKERYNIELRAELFNVLNSTEYQTPNAGSAGGAPPASNVNNPARFGQSPSTPEVSSTIELTGGPRTMMLGLKFTF